MMRPLLKTALITLTLLLTGLAFSTTPVSVTSVNVNQNGFSVVWVSDQAEQGLIRYGTTSTNVTITANDVRGALTTDKIHFAQVTGLLPNTLYYVSVKSGSTTDDNAGRFYLIRTSVSSSGFSPGVLTITNVNSYITTLPVTGDAIVFGKAIRTSSGEESLPNAILFRKGQSSEPYDTQFVYGNFCKKDGTVFGSLSASDKLVLSGWTPSDGFGGEITVNSGASATADVSMTRMVAIVVVSNDTTAPSAVTSVTALANFGAITLTWTPSSSSDNAGTIIVRKTGSSPVSTTDGTLVYNSGGSSYSDTAVSGGTTYYYALFSRDTAGNFGAMVTVSATAIASVSLGGGSQLDNFEDGNSQNKWGYYWYTYDDSASPNFGNSIVGMSINNTDGAAGTTYSAQVSYTLGAAYQYRFVALGVDITANTAEIDMNSYTGIEFYAKGDGHRLAVELSSSANISPNYYAYDFTTSANWIKMTIPFISFSQPGFGPAVSLSEALRRMKAIHFKASSQISGESGSFRVDEIRFITGDFVAPNPVSAVSVNLISDAPLLWKLVWNNSSSTDNAGTLIVRRTDRYATATSDGTIVFSGQTSQYTDSNVTLNQGYYYSLYAFDYAGNYSTAVQQFARVDQTGGGGLQSGLFDVSPNLFSGSTKLANNDYVSRVVTLTVYVRTGTVSANAIGTLNISGTVTQSVTFNVPATDNAISFVTTLSVGNNLLKVSATDWNGNISAEQAWSLKVANTGDAMALKSGTAVLPYPTPYNPELGNLTLAFELNQSGTITLYIYNISGKLLSRPSFAGKAGYNEVTISGTDAFGQKWANGVYIVRVVSDKTVIGTGKFLVIR